MVASLSSAEIYRWVDDEGRVHFGDKPGSGKYDAVELERQPETPATDNSTPEEELEEKNQDQADTDTTDAEDTTQDEDIVDMEDARQQRIDDMEALAEELKVSREKREAKRDKDKKELGLLREGCAKAEERIAFLQAQIDQYIASQARSISRRKFEEVTLDSKRRRMAVELETRQEYVNENCSNL